MITVIHHTTQKARKEYCDDGYEYIRNWIDGGCYAGHGKKITFAEARILVAHRQKPKPYMILPGETYVRQFNSIYGDTCTFRMNEQLYKLCCKYDLWPEL